ncbi:hypothetical protein MMC30_007187 [Trapelia coarctata]|nr:hypothetical protein [Trapelia coarctata]
MPFSPAPWLSQRREKALQSSPELEPPAKALDPHWSCIALLGVDIAMTDPIKYTKVELGHGDVQFPNPGWRPPSLRKPYLCLLAICSIAVIAGTEILVRLSNRTQAVLSFDLIQPQSCITELESCAYAYSSVSNGLYFCYKYLPTLLAVILAALWENVDRNIRTLESYYQLARPGGALAEDSLLLDYNLIFILKVPWKALRKRHHLVLLSFVVFSLAGIAAPILQSALFDVDISPAGQILWTAKVGTNTAYARALQALHGCIIVLVIALASSLHRRRNTGLYSDPSCVAALAAIVGPTLRKDLANLDLADEKAIENTISRRRYHLHHSIRDDGTVIYQLDLVENQDEGPGGDVKLQASPDDLPEFNKPLKTRNSPISAWSSGMFTTVIVVLFGIEAFNTNPSVKFVFSYRIVPVAIGVVVKELWKLMDRDFRNNEPYHYLALHPLAHRQNFTDLRRVFRSPLNIDAGFKINPAPGQTTIFLDYGSRGFFSIPLYAAWNKHFSMCTVAIISWLLEIFTVTMGSLGALPCYRNRPCQPGKPIDSSPTAINVSVCLSFAILTTAAFWMLFVLLPRIGMKSVLSRNPDTMASVLCWLHSSRLVRILQPMSVMSGSQRKEFQKGLRDRNYGLGWINGENEPERFGIDEEPVAPFVNAMERGTGLRSVVRYRAGETVMGLKQKSQLLYV